MYVDGGFVIRDPSLFFSLGYSNFSCLCQLLVLFMLQYFPLCQTMRNWNEKSH